jgi:haloalkane dehalogenase
VKAIAFLEALLRPYPSWDAFPRPGAAAQFAQVFRSFRGDAGRAVLIDDDTNFINLLLLPVMGVDLSMEDLDRYWAPLANKEDREPVWRWTNEIPVADDPPDVASLVEDYSRALCESSVPKLLIYHPNGVIVNEPEAEWCRNNLKNFQCVRIDTPLAAPIHFLQERFPEEVGQALARWHEKL